MTIDLHTKALAGRRVLIVGGTSGIGLATAIQATAAGADVIVLGSDAGRAEQAAARHNLSGWRAADVTQPSAIKGALADIDRVDHLVLMAGSFIVGRVLDADVAQFRRVFDERLWAAVHALQALGDRLAPDASVTFISGAIAERPNAHGTAILAAASSAMEALARGLALELAPRRVNTIAPGPTETPLLDKVLGEGRESYVANLAKSLPLGRLGSAEEVGAANIFLMTNGSMTGATLHIDGGSRLV